MSGSAGLSTRFFLKCVKRKKSLFDRNTRLGLLVEKTTRMFSTASTISMKPHLDAHSNLADKDGQTFSSHSRRYFSGDRKKISVEVLSPTSTQEEVANAVRPYFHRQLPVLLQGLNSISNCRAMESWSSLDYLQSKVGEDTPCFVEVGGSYANSDVQRPEITVGDYILYMKMFQDKYERSDEGNSCEDQHSISPKQGELVYMAQNDMFPQLWDDFQLPNFCQNPSLKVGKGNLYSTMFWFGPRGCVSPLHFDPLDNLLMQFAGRKRVILYPPSHDRSGQDDQNLSDSIPWHYAGHDGQQHNTSPIDLNDEDIASLEETYPLFAQAPVATECLLEPGSILYIPSKWWHHVTSIDTAISVNAWWR